MSEAEDTQLQPQPPVDRYRQPEPEGLRTNFGAADYVLFVLTIFPSFFALMFVTSAGVHFLENVRGRRVLMLAFLSLELALVALVLARTID